MLQAHHYQWRVKTKLIEGIGRRTSTIDVQLYIDKTRTQYAWHSYGTIANLTDHYKTSHYVDLSSYSEERDGIRLRQCRYLAMSDTFSSRLAGDLAISTVHPEMLVRFKRLLLKSQTARLMDATALQLSNYSLKSLSPECRNECLVRFNASQLQEIFGIASQKANSLRGLAFIQSHQILFSCAPVDYSYLTTPLDTLLLNIKSHFKKLLRNHKRVNFSHSTPQVVSHLKSNYSATCSDCRAPMPMSMPISPPSLLELTSFYVHRRLAICHHTAYLQKDWLDRLNIPNLLKRMIFDFTMSVCKRENVGKSGVCNVSDCESCSEYRQAYHRSGLYIDHSNSEMRHRESNLSRLSREQWKWPMYDFGECGSIFKSYSSDVNKFIYNITTNTFLHKAELHGQMYALEVTDGATPIHRDEAGLRRIRNRIRAMLKFMNVNPDLRFSLKRSEVWVFCPENRSTPKDHQFHKAVITNFVSSMTNFHLRNYQ